MPLPSQIATVPVTGTFEQGDGTPYSGTATAVASVVEVQIPAAGAVVVPPVFSQILDVNGSISLPLWTTDNPAYTKTGWTWTVTVALNPDLNGNPGPTYVWNVAVPTSSGGVVLASLPLASDAPSAGTTAFVTQAGVNSAIAAYIAQNGTSGGLTLSQVDTEVAAGNSTVTTAIVGTPTPPSTYNTLAGLYAHLAADESSISTNAANVALKRPKLTPTTLLTGAATLGASDLARCNPDAGTFTATLPTTPPDGTCVGARHEGVATSPAVAVTLAAGGSDLIVGYGTATATTQLLRPGHGKELQYVAASGLWLVVRDSLSFLDLQAVFAPITGSTQYASAAAAFKSILLESGDVITQGMDLRPNGVRMPGVALLVNAFAVEQDIPATGAQSWRLVDFQASGTIVTIGTVTVPALTRAAVVGSLNYTVAATSRLLVQNTSVAGTYNGQGVTAVIALGSGSSLSEPSAPATPTGLAVSSTTATSVTLTWGSTSGATSYLLVADGIPVVITTSTTATYAVATGSSHSFQVAALCPGAMSGLSSSVGGQAFTSYTFFSQSDGAPVGWTTALGGSSTGQAVTVTSNVLHLTSGNTASSGATADMVGAQVNADSGTHTLWDEQGQYALDNTLAVCDIYQSATAMTSTFGFTNGVQFELNASQMRIGIKAVGYLSGAFTTPTYTTTTGATSGYATYPTGFGMVADGAHFYGWRARIIDNGDGTLTAELRLGTTAQLAAGTLPVVLSAVLPSAFKTAMAPGNCYIRQLGSTNGTTATTCGSRWQVLTVTPTTAAGV